MVGWFSNPNTITTFKYHSHIIHISGRKQFDRCNKRHLDLHNHPCNRSITEKYCPWSFTHISTGWPRRTCFLTYLNNTMAAFQGIMYNTNLRQQKMQKLQRWMKQNRKQSLCRLTNLFCSCRPFLRAYTQPLVVQTKFSDSEASYKPSSSIHNPETTQIPKPLHKLFILQSQN